VTVRSYEQPGLANEHVPHSVDLRLEVEAVTVKVGKFKLAPVSFVAPGSAITALVGPNGSGKTTLLKLVSGALKPASGAVRWNGQDVHAMSPRERARHMALVAQESALHFPMSVLEYCLLARHPFGEGLQLAAREDVDIVRWALNVVRASEFERRWMNELSGGERQRIILARALAQTPRLLLLDEPTLNLDVAFQMELLELVEQIARECGMVVLMVTHELNLAAEFARHVLLLREGVPLAFGPVSDVFTEDHLHALFNSSMIIDRNPVSGSQRVTLLRSGKRSDQ
jgi:iron complex transport system ATP-binding protein